MTREIKTKVYKGLLFDFFGVICIDTHLEWLKENGFSSKIDELVHEYYQHSDEGEFLLPELYEKLGRLVGRAADVVEREINSFIKIDGDVVHLI